MKKTVLFIDTALPINGRTEKMLNSLQKTFPGIKCYVVTWNRRMEDVSVPDYYYLYQQKSELGNRIKKFLNIFGFKKYVREVVSTIKPDVIIASHWDSLFTVPKGLKKKSYVIYDNIDLPEGNPMLRSLERVMEGISISKADMIVHASRFFQELFANNKAHQCVIENKPMLERIKRGDTPDVPLRISYIGTIRYSETLIPLIESVAGDPRFVLDFYGGGPDYEYLKMKATDNVRFHGKYHFSEVGKFYNSSDIVWAAYPNKDFNVKYAISNKYHETLNFETPGIFATETKLGDFVKEKGVGFVVNPYNRDDVKNLLIDIVNNPSMILQARNNIDVLLKNETSWEDDMRHIYAVIKE